MPITPPKPTKPASLGPRAEWTDDDSYHDYLRGEYGRRDKADRLAALKVTAILIVSLLGFIGLVIWAARP